MAKKKSRVASSGRRVGSVLVVLGIFFSIFASATHLALFCTTGNSCTAALIGAYDLNEIHMTYQTAQTTASIGMLGAFSLIDFIQTLEQVGIYAMMIGLFILISMEAVELKYLKQLTQKRKVA